MTAVAAAVQATQSPTDAYGSDTQARSGKVGSHSFEAGAVGETGRASNKYQPDERPIPATRKLKLVASVDVPRVDTKRAASRGSTGELAGTPSTPDSGVPRTMSNSFPSSESIQSGLDPLDDAISIHTRSLPIPRKKPSDCSDSIKPLGDNLSAYGEEPPSFRGSDASGLAATATPLDEIPSAHSGAIQANADAERPDHHVRAPAAPAYASAERAATRGAGLRLVSTLTTSARHHRDVDIVIKELQQALMPIASQDDTETASAASSPPRLTGASALRRIARAERHAPEALHRRALDFYKSLTALADNDNDPKAARNVALMVAALAQRTHAEGYDALDRQLIKRVLDPLMHSLSPETLGALARLNDRTDGMGKTILHDAGKLLGVHNRSRKQAGTPQAMRAAREHRAASLLLGLVAELAREHGRAASWDRPGAAALVAARNGQPQQLSAAIREMYYGDLLTGEMDRPRVERLMDLMSRFSPEQQYAMATMLRQTPEENAASRAFDKFMADDLFDFERDPTIRDQMVRFIDDLRTACRGILGAGGRPAGFRERNADIRAIPAMPTTPSIPSRAAGHNPPAAGAQPGHIEYPAVVTPMTTLGMSFRKARHSIAAKLRWTPTPQDAAKAVVKGAVHTLIDGGRITDKQLQALQGLAQRPNGKGGKINASFTQIELVRDRLSKLRPDELAQLRTNLATARQELQAATTPNATLQSFYRTLHDRMEKEAGIRRGAAALAGVIAALPHKKHPEALLDAMDKLADAQCQALNHQSEMDFHEEALNRLGQPARKALHKLLKGREDVKNYMRRLHGQLSYMPKVWQQYRQSQLEILSRLAGVPA
ncbi:Type III effector protein [Bordetella sputigena]|uniref:hypothetical protein n=1 Tax=Bordetella sputigena TaxID=1416810 RepID=UPI0039EF1A39